MDIKPRAESNTPRPVSRLPYCGSPPDALCFARSLSTPQPQRRARLLISGNTLIRIPGVTYRLATSRVAAATLELFYSKVLLDGEHAPRSGVLQEYDPPRRIRFSCGQDIQCEVSGGCGSYFNLCYLLERPGHCNVSQRAACVLSACNVRFGAVVGNRHLQ